MERKNSPSSKKRRTPKLLFGVLALLVVVLFSVDATLAYLTTQTSGITNTFTSSQVSTQVTEDFNGTTKSNVNATNTGDTAAYIRIKLVTYRVNDKMEHIGGTAEIPTFTPGSGWVEKDGYYYYMQPVEPGAAPAASLIDSINLKKYDDADGGKQVIEVMAEAIQSQPASAVQSAWGFNPESLGGVQ